MQARLRDNSVPCPILPKSNVPEQACLTCGACCAAFRVDFHPEDLASPGKSGVPEHLTIRLTPTLVRMYGTDEAPPRCVALEGEIGKSVRCSIYRERPGPCRDFAPYAPLGMGDDACDRARRRYGLPPLEL